MAGFLLDAISTAPNHSRHRPHCLTDCTSSHRPDTIRRPEVSYNTDNRPDTAISRARPAYSVALGLEDDSTGHH